MKQKYIKPSIVMERFDMSQSIAAGCGAASNSPVGDPNIWDKAGCGWVVGGDVIWNTEQNASCTFHWEETDDFEGVCYNNPNGGQTIFSSY